MRQYNRESNCEYRADGLTVVFIAVIGNWCNVMLSYSDVNNVLMSLSYNGLDLEGQFRDNSFVKFGCSRVP